MSDIPAKLLKNILRYLLTFYALVLIVPLNLLCFLQVLLKSAEVTPLLKKGKKMRNKTVGQDTFKKLCQKLMKEALYQQMSCFFQDIFSKHQCVFIKDFSTQECLLTSLKKWKNAVNKVKVLVVY